MPSAWAARPPSSASAGRRPRPIPCRPGWSKAAWFRRKCISATALLAHGGLGEFPIPISTPGFDASPYTTASNWITKDPETGWTNTGNYRGQIKAPDRMSALLADLNHGEQHWHLARKRGQPLEAALVIGGPPALTYAAGTRVPYGVEEYAVAGSLIGEPLEVVRCKTVDLTVPAHAEIVIEGYFSNEYLEPEGPFGEYTGYMGERGYAAVFQVTAITHRKNPIFTSIISQMPPSESSTLKKVGQDNAYLYLSAQPVRHPFRQGRPLPPHRPRQLVRRSDEPLRPGTRLAGALRRCRPPQPCRQDDHRRR